VICKAKASVNNN